MAQFSKTQLLHHQADDFIPPRFPAFYVRLSRDDSAIIWKTPNSNEIRKVTKNFTVKDQSFKIFKRITVGKDWPPTHKIDHISRARWLGKLQHRSGDVVIGNIMLAATRNLWLKTIV